MDEPTHIVFDGSKIIISPNLHPIFDFLQKIENEISGLLTIEKRLNDIRENALEIMGLCETLSKVVVDNNIDFKHVFKKDPGLIAEKLVPPQLTRIEMITLFAYLETMVCLYIAYENETSDEKQIMLLSKDAQKTKKIINKLILTDKNEYYGKNRTRFVKINAQQLRDLRNKLSHFFSVAGVNLVPDVLNDQARAMEKKVNYSVSFISPNDMNELLRYGSLLLLKKWSHDCQTNKPDFERRISFVKAVVERDGAILAYNRDILD